MSSLRPKVFITNSTLEKEVIEYLVFNGLEVKNYDGVGHCPRHVLKSELESGVRGLIVSSSDEIDEDIIDSGKSLKVISTCSVGFDHINIPFMKKKGIAGGYTPDVVSASTAETALTLVLMLLKRIQEAQNVMRTYQGYETYYPPKWVVGNDLRSKTVGIVGLGRIGHQIMQRILAFEPAEILYTGVSGPKEGVIGKYASFRELIERSDIVIISCSLNEKTKHLFNMSVFKKMKEKAVLINIARGGIVNQEDLLEALKVGEIGGAGMDVMTPEPLPQSHPFLSMDNVVLFPHIGTNTVETKIQISRLAAENVVAGIKQRPMPSRIP